MSKPKVYVILLVTLLILLYVASLIAQFALPAPTGSYPVGRASRVWVDSSRQESIGPKPGQAREVPVEIWYPAQVGSGRPSPYFPRLASLAQSLTDSGEIPALQVFLLRFVRSPEKAEALVAEASGPYPVILLSPGNGTNVEFYAGLADELASQGYVVIGINHPYDVAGTTLLDGSIAQFSPGPFEFQAHEAWVRERLPVRTEDVLFALDQLEVINQAGDDPFAGQLDLSRVGVMGHSLGGITAVQACNRDTRFRACLNFDGIQRGGPFSVTEDIEAPSQPFMFITKEEEIAPAFTAVFAQIPGGSYQVVIRNAHHDNFTDGPALLPSLLPTPSRGDQILALTRTYTLAFFEQTLRAKPDALLRTPFDSPDVRLEVYPPL